MSAPEIDINALMDVAVETANDLLTGASECVTALLEILPEDQAETMGKRPMLVAAHALLQHLDCRAEERQQQQAAMIEALHELRNSIDFLAGRRSDKAALASMPLTPEKIVAACKERWLAENPSHTDKQYAEAIYFFEKLAGL